MIKLARSRLLPRLAGMLLTVVVGACTAAPASGEATRLPDPAVDPPVAVAGDQVAVLAGGCFWGLQAVFEHVRGVRRVRAGYAGGAAGTASYGQVGMGNTGHAESVKIIYDPARISYGQLLKVFFSVAHDPTQLNRQGPDRGTQYRSEIFYTSEQQRQVASGYINQLDNAKVYGAPIVTRLEPLKGFYEAEDYHQDYARKHPDDPYIRYNDAPKVTHLRQLLPQLYRPEQTSVEVRLH